MIKRMKRTAMVFVMFLMVLVFAETVCERKAQAKQTVVRHVNMGFKAVVTSESKMELTWKQKYKKKKGSLVIVRQDLETKEKKKIKPGFKKEKYTDAISFNRRYEYVLKVTVKGKKKNILYQDYIYEAFTGVGRACFDSTVDEGKDYRPRVIENYHVRLGGKRAYNGIEPDGYVFYRSTDKLHKQEIYEGREPFYIDETTELGKRYFYWIQAYYIYQGRVVYGEKSECASVLVSRSIPLIRSEIVSEDETTGEIRVKITSDSYNPEFIMDCLLPAYVPWCRDGSRSEESKAYRVDYYSDDGQKTWHGKQGGFEHGISVDLLMKPGQELYFLLRPTGKTWRQIQESYDKNNRRTELIGYVLLYQVVIGRIPEYTRSVYLDPFTFAEPEWKLREGGGASWKTDLFF